ncbi:hypothetical protein [Psychrobacillus sp. FSL H8-0510]|uniref:hypothetical protein n=1 Tax=Psychrobacillus sp. FSL H8-0510 TaxID=2921394 RepID=UPI0030FA1121
MSNSKKTISNLKVGCKIYSIKKDEVIEKEVVLGENNDPGLALKGFISKDELDSSWDWGSNNFLTRREAELAREKQLEEWSSQFVSKSSIIQFLFDNTAYSPITQKKRGKLVEAIKKELKVTIDLDKFH